MPKATRKYTLHATIGVSATTTVRAASEAEAIRIAESRGVVLSRSFRSSNSDVWVVEDADGEVENITVESGSDDDDTVRADRAARYAYDDDEEAP